MENETNYPYLLEYRRKTNYLNMLSAAIKSEDTREDQRARYLDEYKEIKEELNRIVEESLKNEKDLITLETIKNAVIDQYGTMWDNDSLQVVLNRARIRLNSCLLIPGSSEEECRESNKPQSPLRTGLYDYDEKFCELSERNRLVKNFCEQNKGNADCEDVNTGTSISEVHEYTSESSVLSAPPVQSEAPSDVQSEEPAPSIGPGLTTVNQSADLDDSTVTYDGSYQEQASTLIQEGLPAKDVYQIIELMEGNIDEARDIIKELPPTRDYSAANPVPAPPSLEDRDEGDRYEEPEPSSAFRVGDAVDYHSQSRRRWLPAEVVRVHRDGTYMIRSLADRAMGDGIPANHLRQRVDL